MAAQRQVATESWDISPEDALRVPLVTSDVERGNDVAKWNIVDNTGHDAALGKTSRTVKNEKYAVFEANPYEVQIAPEYEDSVPVLKEVAAETEDRSTFEAEGREVIAVYSPTSDYFNILVNLLSMYESRIKFVRFDESSAKLFFDKHILADAYIINMSDDDESELLDTLLDAYGDEASLFLCEASPSDKCVKKVEEFIGEL